MAIDKINGLLNIKSISSDDDKPENIITAFSDYLKGALDKTNELKIASDDLTDAFATGQTDNIHEVMIASEKAGVAMEFTLKIRSKVLDAYNEVMRMQI